VRFVGSAREVSVRSGVARVGNADDRATIELHGYDFYEEKLTIDDETAEQLSEWFRDPESFYAWSSEQASEKKCGGFHPDYVIEWKKDDESVVVLVCLGCCEIKAYFGRRAVRLNIRGEAHIHVRRLLDRAAKKSIDNKRRGE
jgi:hypothetical protein